MSFAHPSMIAGRIDRQSHDLHISAIKLRFDFRHVTKLGRADGREVLRVRKQNGPRIADPIMEPDPSFTGFCFEIRCCISNFHCSTSSVL